MVFPLFGTPEGTRTPNPRNRNPMLYPLSHRRIYYMLYIISTIFPFVKSVFINSPTPDDPLAKTVVFSGYIWYNWKNDCDNCNIRKGGATYGYKAEFPYRLQRLQP